MTKFLEAYSMLVNNPMANAMVEAQIQAIQPPPTPEQLPLIRHQFLQAMASQLVGQRGAFAAGVVGQKVPTNQLNLGTAQ